LQYNKNDSIFLGFNLNLLGTSITDSIKYISRLYLEDSQKGEYTIYYPFIAAYYIKKVNSKIKGSSIIYFPEKNCPEKERINRLYYPAGTKYYPWKDKINKEFLKKINKQKPLRLK